MAMNEDSVVSSLNELRRMANDRARRETEARARVEDRSTGNWGHGRRSDGRIRATEMRGAAGGYQEAGHAPTLMGGHEAGPAPQGAYGGYGGYGYGHPVQPAALPDIAHEPPRQKSAVGPVLLTILILGGAAAGGYWKLQQDFQVALKARDAAVLAAEEARNKAVEVAARAEQMVKAEISKSEQRAKTAASVAPAPAAEAAKAETPAPAAAKPAVAAKVAKAEKSKKARRASNRRLAKAVLPPVEEEKKLPALPKIAGKKKVTDDPLAGLKM